MHRRIAPPLLLILSVVAPFAARADGAGDEAPSPGPLAPAQVPEPLKPWIGWSLRGHEEALCPRENKEGGSDASPLCLWPARLQLDLGGNGGRFSQGVRLYREAAVELPGGQATWPLDVRVDGQPVPVVEAAGAPVVWLKPGDHALAGGFSWSKAPESLQIPQATGLVSLTLRGKPVPSPSRDANGLLWLSREQEEEKGESKLTVKVWRQLIDDVPLRVVTRVQLDVSGKNREVLLGRALLDGLTPLSLVSELPARLEPDGHLRVQVRPGTFRVELAARSRGPVESLALPAGQDGPWSAEEVWTFSARPWLRVAELSGVLSLDPAQTDLPEEWRALPAYRMRPGDTLKLATTRRGDAEPAPDQLSLTRTLWLDFDGRGLTAKDRLGGTLTRSDRLEMPEPAALGRVRAQGKDQLITRLTPGAAPGVELREGRLSLEAESRAALSGGSLSAVGWSHGVRALSMDLELPPGYRLLHASGADEVSPTWLQGWSLLDLFLLLLATLAAGKLFGWPSGLAMFVALGLSLPEGAPKWSWMIPLAAEALLRVVPAGRVQLLLKIARGAALGALLLMLAPFAVHHLRVSIYPGLEREMGFSGSGEERSESIAEEMPMMALAKAAPPPQSPAMQRDAMIDLDESGGGGVGGLAEKKGGRGVLHSLGSVTARASSAPAQITGYQQQLDLSKIDPNAVAQTGPGLPDWSWRSIQLRWSGPVEPGARVQLWLLSPWMNLLLAFLRVLLLAAVWLKLLAPGAGGQGGLRALLARIPARGAAAALVLLGATLATSGARAGELPSSELLEELRNRLTAPPACGTDCVASPRLIVEAGSASLRLRMQLEVAAGAAAPLPGALGHWSPESVLLDGKPAAALERGSDGTLWIALAPGLHQLVLEGSLPARDELTLALPLKPKQVEAHLSGWTLEGLNEDGTPAESLQLVRVQRGEAKSERLEPGQLPPFVEVERALLLGLSWQVRTRVQRLSPDGAPITLEVPLLPGESITSAEVHAQGGVAQVSFGPHQSEVSWTSSLATADPLQLTAADAPGFSEVWRLEVAPTWHVEASGVPPIHQEPAAQRVPAYRPWPGESLSLKITRPDPVAGASLTLQSSQLTVTPGARSADARLAIKLSSSRGAPTEVTLPEGAELQALSLDGATLPVRQDGRKVSLALTPGEHQAQLDWREPRGLSILYKTPQPDLKLPSVNSSLALHLPSRWVLAVGGPRLGPAVLIWSFAIVMLLCSLGLSRLGNTPLRAHQWALLALGLTQIPLPAAACVAGWFLVLGWRRSFAARIPGARRFDLMQLGLLVWTLVAAGALIGSIERGLLGEPEMQVAGNGSSASLLNWFVDRSGPTLTQAWVLSLPIFVYRLAMLAWALWLALAMVRWLPWAWESFAAGDLWRPFSWRRAKTAPPATTTSAPVVEAIPVNPG